jgi:ABC-2 type transport system ATP-binding protein
MIEIRNLSKTFGDKTVLENLSLTVSNEIYGLLGPNGSGKTTLMRILTGILKPTEGKAVVGGFDVSGNSLKVRQVVGYVPESPVLYESLTPNEFFDFVGKIRGVPRGELEKKVNSYVKAFGIEPYIEQFIGALSFGTQQKVSIIAALLHDPKVLILDEAMNGLDAKSARIFRELLFRFKEEGKSIIFSTHVLPLAEIVCDRVGVIYQGRLVAEGSVEDLKKAVHERNLEDVFLKLTESEEEIHHLINALK